MEIRYLYNSGFCITEPNFTIIADYYLDTCGPGDSPDETPLARIAENGVIGDDTLARKGKLYVLSSHFHRDHFNRVVLDWYAKKKDIVYIFSKDIKRYVSKFKDTEINFIRKGSVYEDENLLIKAFGSTDCGVSFLITLKDSGKTLFHAGDLNNWHWAEESSKEESAQAQKAYLSELEQIAAETDYIDAVMFPTDPRLGAEYALGAKQFLEKIKCGMFFPMHFLENYDAGLSFEDFVRSKGSEFAKITARGDAFTL